MPYEPRTYRKQSARSGLTYFSVSWLETDLWIGVDTGAFFAKLPEQVRQEIILLRQQLNHYISEQPEFLHSFSPVRLLPSAPEIARLMADAAAPWATSAPGQRPPSGAKSAESPPRRG